MTNRQSGTDFVKSQEWQARRIRCRNARITESRKSESAEYFLGLHCSSNPLLKNHANKYNLSFGSKICCTLTFTAGGGVGLQWLSDGGQGGRVPPCAVDAVGGHASVLANAQSNREQQGAWVHHVWPVTGRCSLSGGVM